MEPKSLIPILKTLEFSYSKLVFETDEQMNRHRGIEVYDSEMGDVEVVQWFLNQLNKDY